jgi:hypothetical protein
MIETGQQMAQTIRARRREPSEDVKPLEQACSSIHEGNFKVRGTCIASSAFQTFRNRLASVDHPESEHEDDGNRVILLRIFLTEQKSLYHPPVTWGRSRRSAQYLLRVEIADAISHVCDDKQDTYAFLSSESFDVISYQSLTGALSQCVYPL